ncbi:AAA family ATPase [Agrobacterium rubi]|nr:AAA family ATPase [Agrobacterium rubi]NTF24501.1 AAA family ATPase [Agrobacterium rubi]
MTTITAQFTQFLGDSKTFALARYENGPNLDDVKVSGAFNPFIEQGEWFTAEGRWRESFNTKTRKNEQKFVAYSMHPALPITRKGITQLLIHTFNEGDHGVNLPRIQAFVEKHGLSAALKAEKNFNLLLELTSDPKAYSDRIFRDWSRRISNREAMRLLEKSGIKAAAVRDILNIHKNATLAVMKRNPYEFITVPSVSFDDVDKLGKAIGIKFDDPRRVRAVLSHLASRSDEGGHTFVPYSDLKADFKRLEITGAALTPVLADTANADVVIVKDPAGNVVVQKKSLMDAERRISKRIAELLSRRDTIDRAYVDRVTDEVLSQEKYRNTIMKDPSQIEAVRRSVREPVAVLTGGPGTGKSTVTEAIAEIISRTITGKLHLAAPAGKAARRQDEATKYKYNARTVHSLLESKGKGGNVFGRNKARPLDSGAFVVIDEASMLDVEVAAALLEALPPNGRILFIGDEAQLQSVGPGNFFGDIMRARAPNGNCVPVSKLEKVHRNSAESKIAHYARQIREGTFSSAKLDGKLRPDVAFMEYPNNGITDKIVGLVARGARKSLNLDPMRDVAVICPKKAGNAGTWQLNAALSQALNPKGKAIEGFVRGHDDKDEPIPRVEDRVMLTENDGDNSVSNGDVGTIIGAGKDPENGYKPAVWVKFDTGETVAFNMSDARKLILAYAITGHKSQGSQYPLVVMPMTMDHKNMLDKNLVYTEWTRAQRHLILVGDKEALEYGVSNVVSSQRRTRLQEFLDAELAKLPAVSFDMPPPPSAGPAAAPARNPFRSSIRNTAPLLDQKVEDDAHSAVPNPIEALQASPRRSFHRRPAFVSADNEEAASLPSP